MDSYIVDSSSDQISLRLFIKKKIKGLSAKQVEKLIAANGCEVNQKLERFGSTKLFKGDLVRISTFSLETAEDEEIPILFEDDYLCVIDKPSNVPSSLEILQKKLKKKLFLVHRLDKQTSGVLLLAKSEEAQKQMQRLFFDRKIEKYYIAAVHGRVKESKGEINQSITLKKRYEGGVLYGTAKFGKKAQTLYKRLALGKEETLLFLKPITGRTHQLRVHLNAIEHPILGDPLYKSVKHSSYLPSRLLLHAYKVSFIHPFSGKKIAFIAPIASIMNRSIQKLFKKFKLCEF